MHPNLIHVIFEILYYKQVLPQVSKLTLYNELGPRQAFTRNKPPSNLPPALFLVKDPGVEVNHECYVLLSDNDV